MSNLSNREAATAAPPPDLSADQYRRLVGSGDLVHTRVRVKQTDILVSGRRGFAVEAAALVRASRRQIEGYIASHPGFESSLVPIAGDPTAPPVVAAMIAAAALAGVGPMAAVAGAVAEYVGHGLASGGGDLIVENGGDLFVRSAAPRELLLLAENSAFVGLRIALPPSPAPIGVGTSSGTLGHSLSFGGADAVMAVAASASLADAAATAIANTVKGVDHLEAGLARAREIGVDGVVVLAGDRMAAWGDIRIAG